VNHLKQFRIQGTTSDILFQKTLKMRPIEKSTHTRAMKYCFHDKKHAKLPKDVSNGHSSASTKAIQKMLPNYSIDGASSKRLHGIMRRVTLSVLPTADEEANLKGIIVSDIYFDPNVKNIV